MAVIVEKSISFSAIEEIAGKIRTFIDSKFPDDEDIHSKLRKFVALLGGEVLISESPDDKEVNGGSLIIFNNKKFKIYLSPHTTPLRDNFTIAHELGHFFLHTNLNQIDPRTDYIYFNRYGSDKNEQQANRFAAALLMPKQLFTEKYREYKDVSLLSGFFGVSSPAVKVRIDCLGLITR